jgi:O-antigen ligase
LSAALLGADARIDINVCCLPDSDNSVNRVAAGVTIAVNLSRTGEFLGARGEPSALGKALAGLLAVALIAGGRSHDPQYAVVSLAALPALFLLLRDPRRPDLVGAAIFVVLAVAALQLIPMPPSLWRSLPGHDLPAATLDAVGAGGQWRPVSVIPWTTFTALLGLLAPITAFFAARRMSWPALRAMLAGVSLFAIASAILGLLQRLTGHFAIYHAGHEGYATGFFSNRNHLADLILAGIVFTPLLCRPEDRRRWGLVLSTASLLLGLAVFATTSKAGVLLAGPALAAALYMIWRPGPRQLAIGAALFIVAIITVLSLKGLAPVLARFSDPGAAGDRAVIVDTMPVAIRAFWPWGSGYGSFVPVYAAFEDLDLVGPNFVIEAHNDYLQLILEGGLPGTLSLLACLAAIAWGLLSLVRHRAPLDALAPAALVVLLLAHSVVDYPLRMPALSVLFALCLGAIDALRQTIANTGRTA